MQLQMDDRGIVYKFLSWSLCINGLDIDPLWCYLIHPTHPFHRSYIQSCSSYHFMLPFFRTRRYVAVPPQNHCTTIITCEINPSNLRGSRQKQISTSTEAGVPLAPPENLWLAEKFGSNQQSLRSGSFRRTSVFLRNPKWRVRSDCFVCGFRMS